MSLQFPIVSELLHPPFGALRRELTGFLSSGSGDLDRNTGAIPPFNHVNAYGIRWVFFTVPAGFGYTLGSPKVYEQRMIQLSVRYTDAVGNDADLEVYDAHAEGMFFWKEAGPLLIHYEIVPGVSVQFEWLIVKFP